MGRVCARRHRHRARSACACVLAAAVRSWRTLRPVLPMPTGRGAGNQGARTGNASRSGRCFGRKGRSSGRVVQEGTAGSVQARANVLNARSGVKVQPVAQSPGVESITRETKSGCYIGPGPQRRNGRAPQHRPAPDGGAALRAPLRAVQHAAVKRKRCGKAEGFGREAGAAMQGCAGLEAWGLRQASGSGPAGRHSRWMACATDRTAVKPATRGTEHRKGMHLSPALCSTCT